MNLLAVLQTLSLSNGQADSASTVEFTFNVLASEYLCQYRFESFVFATILWRAVLCHRQGLCGADGAAPSTFGRSYAAVRDMPRPQW
jgi:hypothetical protein